MGTQVSRVKTGEEHYPDDDPLLTFGNDGRVDGLLDGWTWSMAITTLLLPHLLCSSSSFVLPTSIRSAITAAAGSKDIPGEAASPPPLVDCQNGQILG